MCINKFNCKKGSSPGEIGIITSGVLLVSFFAFTLFGDNIEKIFQNKNKLAMFNSNSGRASIPKVNPNLLTNTDLMINGQSFKSPVETYIRSTAGGGKLVETNGSAGNMRDIALITKKYIEQIQEMANNNNVNTSGLDNALKTYNNIVDEYIEKDDAIVSGRKDPLIKIINELDFAIDLSQEGDAAKTLSQELDNTLTQLPESSKKLFLKTYVNDLLSLGKNITYFVDSRNKNLLYEEIIDSITTTTDTVTEPTASNPDANAGSTATSNSDLAITMQPGVEKLNLLSSTIMTAEGSISPPNDAYNYFKNYLTGSAEFDVAKTSEYANGAASGSSDGCIASATGDITSINTVDGCSASASSSGVGSSSSSASASSSSSSSSSGATGSGYIKLFSGSTETYKGWFKFANSQELFVGTKDQSTGYHKLWLTTGPSTDPMTIGSDLFGFEVTPTGIIPMGAPGSQYAGTCNTTGYGCTNDLNQATVTNTQNTALLRYKKLINLKIKLEEIYNDPNIDQQTKDDLAKKIKVYLEGNFFEVFKGSYNNDALCSSLRGNVKNNKCVIDPNVYNKPIDTKPADIIKLPPVGDTMPPQKMPPDVIDTTTTDVNPIDPGYYSTNSL